MSPLACSLLALAALFASANALAYDTHVHEPGCAGFKMSVLVSIEPQKELRFDLKAAGDDPVHNIPDYCQKIGAEIQWQSIEVCNDYKGLTSTPTKKAPKTHWMVDEPLSPIYASCDGASECGPLVIHVIQRCNPIKVG